jgi:hypothetical protein
MIRTGGAGGGGTFSARPDAAATMTPNQQANSRYFMETLLFPDNRIRA